MKDREGNGGKADSPVCAEDAAVVEDEVGKGLASLFSSKNLKKYKRKERADKKADAVEVCRVHEGRKDAMQCDNISGTRVSFRVLFSALRRYGK